MADAAFTRWPVAHDLAGAQAQALIGANVPGWPLRAVIDPPEIALLTHGKSAVAALPPAQDAARYLLEEVSDTGPVAEPFGVIMLVAFDVPEDRTDAIDDWYQREHIDLLMKADGWLRARRYRVLSHTNGPRWTSMAFHELRDLAVMDSPERAVARSTPWRAELEKEAWFPAAGRGVFQALDKPLL